MVGNCEFIGINPYITNTYTYTQSLSHSVTQSLSHSVTQSLSHSVTQSLTTHTYIFTAHYLDKFLRQFNYLEKNEVGNSETVRL
jgi:hypothetical protein